MAAAAFLICDSDSGQSLDPACAEGLEYGNIDFPQSGLLSSRQRSDTSQPSGDRRPPGGQAPSTASSSHAAQGRGDTATAFADGRNNGRVVSRSAAAASASAYTQKNSVAPPPLPAPPEWLRRRTQDQSPTECYLQGAEPGSALPHQWRRSADAPATYMLLPQPQGQLGQPPPHQAALPARRQQHPQQQPPQQGFPRRTGGAQPLLNGSAAGGGGSVADTGSVLMHAVATGQNGGSKSPLHHELLRFAAQVIPCKCASVWAAVQCTCCHCTLKVLA